MDNLERQIFIKELEGICDRLSLKVPEDDPESIIFVILEIILERLDDLECGEIDKIDL